MIVAGVDGGATRTRVVLVDETGRVRGSGSAGPSNFDNVGVEAAEVAVRAAFKTAREEAGNFKGPCHSAFLGMAGVLCDADRDVIRSIARATGLAPDDRVFVDHDIRIALAGGLPGREGIVLIAGTGSSCYGRRADGRSHHAGWGYLLDDLGSAYYLGIQAITAAVHAADGRGAPTVLSSVVRNALGYAEIGEILHIVYHKQMTVTGIASLAPAVLSAARENDPVAVRIVSSGADELSRMAEGVAGKLGLKDRDVPVTMVGGLVESDRYYRSLVTGAILRRIPHAMVSDPVLPPVYGAALLALEAAGVAVTGPVISAMRVYQEGRL
jgi:N-acetylglucosamine kinase